MNSVAIPVWMRVIKQNPDALADFRADLAEREKVFFEDLLSAATWEHFVARKEKILFLRSLLYRITADDQERQDLREYRRQAKGK